MAMNEQPDTALTDWATQIPVAKIPGVLALLAARLLDDASRDREQDGSNTSDSEKLLTAGELATRLNLPESWIRNAERDGRIPGVRAGKYVRFKLNDVEQALGEHGRLDS